MTNLDDVQSTMDLGVDTDKLEIDQLRGRAEVAEQERDALASGLAELRANFRALADSFEAEGFREFPRAIREILDAE